MNPISLIKKLVKDYKVKRAFNSEVKAERLKAYQLKKIELAKQLGEEQAVEEHNRKLKELKK